MRTRRLGTCDVLVSELGFGTWAMGSDWWGATDSPQRLVGQALELGVTFFDTSDVYGEGRNEELLGAALAGVPRDQIQIASKFGYVLGGRRAEHSEGERPQDWRPERIRRSLENSLRRLGTDYLDLYQLHNPRMEAIADDGVFEELESLQAAGKIRCFGVALGPAIGWQDEGLAAIRDRAIASVQTVYNMLEQEPGATFLAAGRDHGASVLARVPTSSGLLEGDLTLQTTFTDHRRHRPRSWLVEGLQVVERLRFLEAGDRRTLTQAAIQFALADEQMAAVLPTVTSAAQLVEMAAALSQAPALSAGDLQRINETLEVPAPLSLRR